MFLGTWTKAVCLKHVGNTDSIWDMLKLSVKTPDSWSAHARSTSPGNQSGPAALCMLTLCMLKILTHVGYGERDHTVAWNS